MSEAEMSQVFESVAGVLNWGNVAFKDMLDREKTTEVVGVLDEEADAAEYARCGMQGICIAACSSSQPQAQKSSTVVQYVCVCAVQQ